MLTFFTRKYCSNNLKLKPPWEILFFGADDFSLHSLKALSAEYRKGKLINRLEVATTVKGKSNPVKLFAEKEALKIHKWPLELRENKFHVGFVVSFGHLIPERIIESFPLGMFNVHASLLPRWRGAAPIIYALANGDVKTGITIMKIKPKKFDIGEIISQIEINIPADMKLPELYEKLAKLGAEGLVETLENLPGNLQKARIQPNHGVTYAPRINSNFAKIDFSKMTSRQVYNLNRSLAGLLQPMTSFQEKIVKLKDIELGEFHNDKQPGFVEFDKDCKVLKIICADSKAISVKNLSILGKKAISAKDFNNGYLEKVPIELRFFK